MSALHVPGEGLEDYLVGLRGDFFVGVGAEFRQRAFHDVVRLFGWSFACSALYCALEFVPDAVHGVGGETEFSSVEFGLLEELIEENAAIAFGIAVAGNEARHSSVILDGELYEFPVLQEAVHAGIVWLDGGW